MTLRHTSPLRYPGGKAGLTGFLRDTLELSGLDGCEYFEPYAGGAGAALGLLSMGAVKHIHLNDADVRIYAFWRAALHSTKQFVDRVFSVPLTIEEWKRQREICTTPRKFKTFDVGFAAFYLNRCNRSGVLSGAGPIGGFAQSGSWRLGVRFNRETLAERILTISELRKSISLTKLDALQFLRSKLPGGRAREKVFAYLDPPYVDNGRRLYLNSYVAKDHQMLSRYVRRQRALRWLMSYDDHSLVRDLYCGLQVGLLPLRYSLQQKRAAKELIIAPNTVSLPASHALELVAG